MSQANVVHAAPPAPPGPATFDFSRFKGNAATKMVDTQNLSITANTVTSVKVQAASLQTTMLSAAAIASFDVAPGNVAVFKPTILLSNTGTLFTQPVYMQYSLLVGEPVVPPPVPTWSILQRGSITVSNNQTLGQRIGTGMVVGPGTLYCNGPRPGLASSGILIDLNGGSIYGSSTLYS